RRRASVPPSPPPPGVARFPRSTRRSLRWLARAPPERGVDRRDQAAHLDLPGAGTVEGRARGERQRAERNPDAADQLVHADALRAVAVSDAYAGGDAGRRARRRRLAGGSGGTRTRRRSDRGRSGGADRRTRLRRPPGDPPPTAR